MAFLEQLSLSQHGVFRGLMDMAALNYARAVQAEPADTADHDVRAQLAAIILRQQPGNREGALSSFQLIGALDPIFVSNGTVKGTTVDVAKAPDAELTRVVRTAWTDVAREVTSGLAGGGLGATDPVPGTGIG